MRKKKKKLRIPIKTSPPVFVYGHVDDVENDEE
jgi:hypothetical protein